MKKEYLQEIAKVVFDALDKIQKINFDFELQKLEKEKKEVLSNLDFEKPKLTFNKSDKVFEHIDNDFIEVNGVKISNEIFELGYFVSVDKGKISIFKK